MRQGIPRAAAAATIVLAVAAVACTYYYFVDPAAGGAPSCLFHTLTGYDCPGCGSQRAIHALLHGRFASAWHFNPFIFFAAPAAAFYIVLDAGRTAWPRLHARATHPAILATILIALLLWWLLRNI